MSRERAGDETDVCVEAERGRLEDDGDAARDVS